MKVYYDIISSSLGSLLLLQSQKGLCGIHFLNKNAQGELPLKMSFPDILLEKSPDRLTAAKNEIIDYLNGHRKSFTLLLDIQGTSFQKKVWRELIRIPYGEFRSYQDIAIRLGNPLAARAIGMACHRNPLGIVIPCHRVIGKNGKLTGYAGGLKIKEKLLHLEKTFSYKDSSLRKSSC